MVTMVNNTKQINEYAIKEFKNANKAEFKLQ